MSKKSKSIPEPVYMCLGGLVIVIAGAAIITLLGFLGFVVGPWWLGVIEMAWELNRWLGVFLSSFSILLVLGALTAFVNC